MIKCIRCYSYQDDNSLFGTYSAVNYSGVTFCQQSCQTILVTNFEWTRIVLKKFFVSLFSRKVGRTGKKRKEQLQQLLFMLLSTKKKKTLKIFQMTVFKRYFLRFFNSGQSSLKSDFLLYSIKTNFLIVFDAFLFVWHFISIFFFRWESEFFYYLLLIAYLVKRSWIFSSYH